MDIIIKRDNLEELSTKIDSALDTFKQRYIDPESVIYTNDQLVDLLGVSKSTLQKIRDEGYLSYSRIKGKFFYRQSDLNQMLNNNQIKQYRYESK